MAHGEGREARHSHMMPVLEYTGVTGLVLGISMERVLCTTWIQSLARLSIQ